MSEPSEHAFERVEEEFTKRIEALYRQQQGVLYALCVERMARDGGLLPSSPRRSRPLRNFSQWLRTRSLRGQDMFNNRKGDNTVIIIDNKTAIVAEEGEN